MTVQLSFALFLTMRLPYQVTYQTYVHRFQNTRTNGETF